MHLLGRVAPLFAPVHPAREPVDAEPKGDDHKRRERHVNLQEIHPLQIHSRNLPSTSQPSTCRTTPPPKQATVNTDSGNPEGAGRDTPYSNAKAGANTPAATSAVARVLSQPAVNFVRSL